MTMQNAIKKLEKYGFKIEESKYSGKFNRTFYATHPDYRRYLEIMTQNGDENQPGDVTLIDLRTPGQEDDSMSDYHAGTFLDNVTQGIRAVTTW